METKDGEIVFSIHIYNAGLDTYDDKGKAAGGGYPLAVGNRLNRISAAVVMIACLVIVAVSSLSPFFVPPALAETSGSGGGGDSDNVTFTIPTTIPFKVKADGSVIAPSSWAITVPENQSMVALDDIQVDGLPSGLSLSMYTDDCSTFANAEAHTADGHWEFTYKDGSPLLASTGGTADDPICWGYGPEMRGSKYCYWKLDGLDKNHDLLDAAASGKRAIGKVTISLRAVHKTVFAVYSNGDKSLRMYNRVRVPSVGESYEGKAASAVYTGFDEIWGRVKDGKSFNDGRTNLPWDEHRDDVLSVKVVDRFAPKSIDYWFQWFNKCKEMDLLNLDTSRITLMAHTFRCCSSLTRLDLSSWDLSRVGSFDGPFSQDSLLADIELGGTWRVKPSSVYGLFDGCAVLPSSVIDEFVRRIDTSSCRNFEWAFSGLHNVRSLDLSSWSTSAATCFDAMFMDSYIERLDISSFDSSMVGTGLDASGTVPGSMNQMFWNMPGLREVRLGDKFKWDSSDSTHRLPSPSSSLIDGADGKWYAGSDGAGYAPVDVPSGVADVYYARPATSFAVYSADDGSLDFYNRPGYPNVGDELSGKAVTNVWTGIEEGDWKLAEDQSDTNTPWWGIRDSIRSAAVIDKLKPKSVEGWFYWCVNIESIDVDNLDTSRCASFYATFDRCFKLKSLDISKLDSSNVVKYECMFWGDSALSDLCGTSALNLSKANDFSWMFFRCSALKTLDLTIPESFNQYARYDSMFAQCTNLVLDCSAWNVNAKSGHPDFNSYAPGVSLPACWVPTAFAVYSGDDRSLTFYKQEAYLMPSVGGAFAGKKVTRVYTGFESDEYTGTWPDCTAPWYLDEIGGQRVCRLVKSVAVVDSICPRSMAWWFNQFNYCKTFDLGNVDTSRCTSIMRLFSACSQCVELDGLDKWDTSSLVNMSCAFDGLHRLTEIPGIAGWDTSHVTDFDSAFFNCTALEKLDLSGWSNMSVANPMYSMLGYTSGGAFSALEFVKIGNGWDDFASVGIFARSPKSYGAGSSEYWYASDGTAYAVGEIPSHKSDTYYTSKEAWQEAMESSS